MLIGTSAGGLATVLAAAKMPGLAGWIGLDPVDRTGSGSEPRRSSTAPAVVLLGGASSCNLFGSGRVIARALPHLVRHGGVEGGIALRFRGPDDQPLPRAVRQVIAGDAGAHSPRDGGRDTRIAEPRDAAMLLGMPMGPRKRRARAPEAPGQPLTDDPSDGRTNDSALSCQ